MQSDSWLPPLHRSPSGVCAPTALKALAQDPMDRWHCRGQPNEGPWAQRGGLPWVEGQPSDVAGFGSPSLPKIRARLTPSFSSPHLAPMHRLLSTNLNAGYCHSQLGLGDSRGLGFGKMRSTSQASYTAAARMWTPPASEAENTRATRPTQWGHDEIWQNNRRKDDVLNYTTRALQLHDGAPSLPPPAARTASLDELTRTRACPFSQSAPG
jgi:hypothetical protein